MNFMNSSEVKTFGTKKNILKPSQIISNEESLLRVVFDTQKGVANDPIGVSISFDETNVPPKKVSISFNQHRLDPMDIFIHLLRADGSVYYREEAKIRNIIDIAPDTDMIKIFCFKEGEEGTYSDMNIQIGYIEY